jgi:hypothetical protein
VGTLEEEAFPEDDLMRSHGRCTKDEIIVKASRLCVCFFPWGMGAAGFEISIFVTLFTLFSFPFCFPTVRMRASIQHKESRDCSTDFRKTFETLDTIPPSRES